MAKQKEDISWVSVKTIDFLALIDLAKDILHSNYEDNTKEWLEAVLQALAIRNVSYLKEEMDVELEDHALHQFNEFLKNWYEKVITKKCGKHEEYLRVTKKILSTFLTFLRFTELNGGFPSDDEMKVILEELHNTFDRTPGGGNVNVGSSEPATPTKTLPRSLKDNFHLQRQNIRIYGPDYHPAAFMQKQTLQQQALMQKHFLTQSLVQKPNPMQQQMLMQQPSPTQQQMLMQQPGLIQQRMLMQQPGLIRQQMLMQLPGLMQQKMMIQRKMMLPQQMPMHLIGMQQSMLMQQQMPVQQPILMRPQTPFQKSMPVQQPIPMRPQTPFQKSMPVQQPIPMRPQTPFQKSMPVQQPIPMRPQTPFQPSMPVFSPETAQMMKRANKLGIPIAGYPMVGGYLPQQQSFQGPPIDNAILTAYIQDQIQAYTKLSTARMFRTRSNTATNATDKSNAATNTKDGSNADTNMMDASKAAKNTMDGSNLSEPNEGNGMDRLQNGEAENESRGGKKSPSCNSTTLTKTMIIEGEERSSHLYFFPSMNEEDEDDTNGGGGNNRSKNDSESSSLSLASVYCNSGNVSTLDYWSDKSNADENSNGCSDNKRSYKSKIRGVDLKEMERNLRMWADPQCVKRRNAEKTSLDASLEADFRNSDKKEGGVGNNDNTKEGKLGSRDESGGKIVSNGDDWKAEIWGKNLKFRRECLAADPCSEHISTIRTKGCLRSFISAGRQGSLKCVFCQESFTNLPEHLCSWTHENEVDFVANKSKKFLKNGGGTGNGPLYCALCVENIPNTPADRKKHLYESGHLKYALICEAKAVEVLEKAPSFTLRCNVCPGREEWVPMQHFSGDEHKRACAAEDEKAKALDVKLSNQGSCLWIGDGWKCDVCEYVKCFTNHFKTLAQVRDHTKNYIHEMMCEWRSMKDVGNDVGKKGVTDAKKAMFQEVNVTRKLNKCEECQNLGIKVDAIVKDSGRNLSCALSENEETLSYAKQLIDADQRCRKGSEDSEANVGMSNNVKSPSGGLKIKKKTPRITIKESKFINISASGLHCALCNKSTCNEKQMEEHMRSDDHKMARDAYEKWVSEGGDKDSDVSEEESVMSFSPSGNQGKATTQSGNEGKVSSLSGNQGKVSSLSGNQGKVSSPSGNQGKVSTPSGSQGKVSSPSGMKSTTRTQCITGSTSSIPVKKVSSVCALKVKSVVNGISTNPDVPIPVTEDKYVTSGPGHWKCVCCKTSGSCDVEQHIKGNAHKIAVGWYRVIKFFNVLVPENDAHAAPNFLALEKAGFVSLKEIGFYCKTEGRAVRTNAGANGVRKNLLNTQPLEFPHLKKQDMGRYRFKDGRVFCKLCEDFVALPRFISHLTDKKHDEWYMSVTDPRVACFLSEDFVGKCWRNKASELACSLCKANLAGNHFFEHLQGRFHADNYSKYLQIYGFRSQGLPLNIRMPDLNMIPIGQEKYFFKIADGFKCKVCQSKKFSIKQLGLHVLGKKHRKNLEELKMGNMPGKKLHWKKI